MSIPVFIPKRTVSFGPAYTIETGLTVTMDVTVKASRSLVWRPEGSPFLSLAATFAASAGAEASIELPVTDAVGWGDGAGGVIDVSDGKHSHTYTATIEYRAEGKVLGTTTVGPFVLPAGDGSVVDLDDMLPTQPVAGVVVSIPDSWTEMVEYAAENSGGLIEKPDDEGIFETTAQAEVVRGVVVDGILDSESDIGSALATSISGQLQNLDPEAFEAAIAAAAASTLNLLERVVIATPSPGTLVSITGTPTTSADGLSGGSAKDVTLTVPTAGNATIECFVTLPSTGSLAIAVSRDGTFWLGVDSTGRPKATYRDSVYETELTGVSALPTHATNKLHLALIFNSGVGSLYANGNRVAVGSATAVPVSADTGFVVAGLTDSAAFNWPGKVSHVRVSTVARYSGVTYTIPTPPFMIDGSTKALAVLDSLTYYRADNPLAYPARPPVAAGLVKYKGPTEPTDWLTGDEWVVVS